jgi:hypothetical protein
MLKILTFISERQYLILSMILDLAALITLIKESGSFHFWMLLTASALVGAAHEVVSLIRKSNTYAKKPIWIK